MTINLAKNRKIVCLAANLEDLHKGAEATYLNDELSAEDSLEFLKTAFPQIQKISLIYSASEKVAKELPILDAAANRRNIKLQKLMVQTLPELYTIGGAIAADSEAVFILKDHLIVSGIQTVAQQAAKRGIPVMTSDEGSVSGGGAFAIGVKEAQIGKQGAQMIKQVLGGVAPRDIPPQPLKGPFPLFINRQACGQQNIDVKALAQKAEILGYPIEYTVR